LDLNDYSKEDLWELIVEAVHASVMYPTHKAYTRDTVLVETPNITHGELARRLSIPVGEALVLLKELADDKQKTVP
jgi:hypothetical protein